MIDPASILTLLNIVKTGLDIAGKWKDTFGPRAGAVPPTAIQALRQEVRQTLGAPVARQLRGDAELSRGLQALAATLGDWQVSSTSLCPLVLRKVVAFGAEEKNLGLLPATENPSWLEGAYQQWHAWIHQGPRNNEGLLVYVLESPTRTTIDRIRGFNDRRRTSWYHTVRTGCLDIRSETFFGPPESSLDQYAATFGVDSFWRRTMEGVGLLVG